MKRDMTTDATIKLRTPRPWFGNQQLGAFVISVDRKRAGVLMPEGSLDVRCSAGRHRLSARQWWYRSPSIELDLGCGDVAELSVDLVHRDSVFRRFLTLMFLPWRGLAVTVAQE